MWSDYVTDKKPDERESGRDILGNKVSRGNYVAMPISATTIEIGIVTRLTKKGYKVSIGENRYERQKYDNNVILIPKDLIFDKDLIEHLYNLENKLTLGKKLDIL